MYSTNLVQHLKALLANNIWINHHKGIYKIALIKFFLTKVYYGLKEKKMKREGEEECIYNVLLTNANFRYRLLDDATFKLLLQPIYLESFVRVTASVRHKILIFEQRNCFYNSLCSSLTLENLAFYSFWCWIYYL